MCKNSFYILFFSYILISFSHADHLKGKNQKDLDKIFVGRTEGTPKDFDKVLLIDDLSDTGLTLNKSIEWLKNYGPTKNFINEVKTACLWKKKSSTFEPDFCSVKLESDPWIVQPTEHYEELSIEEIMKRNS